MAGKQAKILSEDDLNNLLAYASSTRYPQRNTVIVLLSVKAGLRAGEIAKLTWEMVLDARGEVNSVIELHDVAAKKNSGRCIPIHNDLRRALVGWRQITRSAGPVIPSERGRSAMKPISIVMWFAAAYRAL